jgi:hypothetical protein
MEPPTVRELGPGTMIDPYRYACEADRALARGDRNSALVLLDQAFLAYDLCGADCEQVRALGRACGARSS